MALSYGFFDAELTPSGQYDRAYAAEQFAEYFHLIVSNGVFPDPATQLQVVASDTPNMNVNVSDGYGWINGYYAKNSGPYPLAIQAASGTLNRIDAVVLRWVNASRSMELAVKTGIAASSPATPALQRDTDVYELMLATVTVAAGATSIPQSSITDKRSDTAVCGWVTGAVQNIDTTNLFAQYDTAFQEWFDNIKSQLSGDVATNLQNQINKNAEGIATINATTLKADTKTALGLPASAGPDDAFKVLANVGNLHVWERVQTYAEEQHTYTLGEKATGVALATGTGAGYQQIWYCSDKITVSNSLEISLVSPSTVSFYSNTTTEEFMSAVAGKFIKYKGHGSEAGLTLSYAGVYFCPGDSAFGHVQYSQYAEYKGITNAQIVTAVTIPAGTTTDYLTSTDRNAYPDQSEAGGQDAYYTLGDVDTSGYYLGPTYVYRSVPASTSLSVSENGTVELNNPTNIVIDEVTIDSVQVLAGKFIRWPMYADGQIVFIPTDAQAVGVDSSNIKFDRYQPVTGHAAIPANTTITYLGQLGGGARIEVGSYVGTGTYGSSNPCSVSASFPIKQLSVFGKVYANTGRYFPIYQNSNDSSYSMHDILLTTSFASRRGIHKGASSYDLDYSFGKKSADGKTFSWYSSGNDVSFQLNESGVTYYYIAIG